MADSTREVREHSRENWTLADLRALVAQVDAWADDSAVALTAPSTRSSKGVIEVSRDAS